MFISLLFRMGIIAEHTVSVCNREQYAAIQRVGNLPGVIREGFGVRQEF